MGLLRHLKTDGVNDSVSPVSDFDEQLRAPSRNWQLPF
jgi:hypothetical protein